MKPCKSIIFFVATITASIFMGCGGGGGGNGGGPSEGPDLRGSWGGIYFVEGRGGSESISATVNQSGDMITISTTKSGPPGQSFSGTMDGSGFITATDASDGETWTTHQHRATPTFLELEDFIRKPTPEDESPPLQIIRLTR